MEAFWTALFDVLILLAVALILGAICEKLRQSAIIGYLLAGTLLGPKALNMMHHPEAVSAMAELGVALLLFTIGLEFSWKRLRRLGPIALGGGTLQLVLTGSATTGVAMLAGLDGRAAVALGGMIAVSSTACVLRLLMSRAEIETIYGRNSLGILLLQDIAVVPLVLMVTVLGQPGGPLATLLVIGQFLLFATILVAGFYLLFNYLVPRLLAAQTWARNRELPILLAGVTALGSAWAAHSLGLSPALGAFIAGMILAESPFSTQIRADVGALRILFVTLFFASIGMLGDPVWVANHWLLITGVLLAVVVGKTVITAGVAMLFHYTAAHALATGICLAQVGEFSFVLANVAIQNEVISDDVFDLVVSITILTLFLTPYLLAAAPRAGLEFQELLRRFGLIRAPGEITTTEPHPMENHIIIIGFGPAGQRVAEALIASHREIPILIVDLNPRTAALARNYNLAFQVGDVTRPEVLEHLHVDTAQAVVITTPAPESVRQVIHHVRTMAPDAYIIVRARYHVFRWEFQLAGAHEVVDEEDQVGRRLAAELRRYIRPESAEENHDEAT